MYRRTIYVINQGIITRRDITKRDKVATPLPREPQSKLADGIERGEAPTPAIPYHSLRSSSQLNSQVGFPARYQVGGILVEIPWPPELTEMVVVRRDAAVKPGPKKERNLFLEA
jgi:hypothetical protein